jgi:hypothetical protein
MLEHHPIAVRVLLLAAILASGFFEAFVLKMKGLACTTWFICVAALTAWIATLGTAASKVIAVMVFLSGFGLLVAYYRIGKGEREFRP